MITRIGANIESKKKTYTSDNIKSQINKNSADKKLDLPQSLNLNYFVSFGAKQPKKDSKKLETIIYNSDLQSKNLLKLLSKEAQESGYDKITTLHVIKHGLEEVDQYIADVDARKKTPKINPGLVDILKEDIRADIFSDNELRKKVQPIIRENIKILDELLQENKPKDKISSNDIVLSEDMVDSIWAIRVNPNDIISPYTIMAAAIDSPDEVTAKFEYELMESLANTLMKNNADMSERMPYSGYENKASNVLKNLSLGTDVFVTYDASKESYQSFLDTLKKVNENSGKKFEIIELNTSAKSNYFLSIVEKAQEDSSKEYIIAACPSNMLRLDMDSDSDCGLTTVSVSGDMVNGIVKRPKNVKFLLYDTKKNFYSLSEGAPSVFSTFEEAPIPTLSTAQMIKYFKENPRLMKDIKKPFSKNAIDKTIEAASQLDGVFPDKVTSLMNKIISYNVNKKEITEKEVVEYTKEATNLFKKDSDDSSVEVIFDTGKRLKGLVGKDSTKKEAAAIVKQIKSNKMGTKGLIIYSQDGFPGGGRKFTAKAIAGEAGVPYIEMNAVDFGTKDVDVFGGGALSPEAAVKQLFAKVKSQAESNANKSALLFIENFEYFSVGEVVSLYHEKAMAQLLREMEKAENAGFNILVAGSVSDPSMLGQAAMKSFKFIDTIEIASPSYDKDARANIVSNFLKTNKIKTKGSIDDQKQLISFVSDITRGFSFIELKSLIKKACSVADERNHKMLDKSDFTEAYLQLLTGRPSTGKIEDHDKQITTSHECGHATNLEVMNNVAKTIGKPWHIPQKVNFVTLDPRGNYGGAVFEGPDKNDEYIFENVFAGMVCAFGGNSAESVFYGIHGSYGISSDMESVRNSAELMVKVMGLGAKTGKMAISASDNFSEDMKKMIEDDERVIINNAKVTSDLITETYADFNRWFTQKYSPLVGTGDCIIDGDEFRGALNQWKKSLPPEKQQKLADCDESIVKIMEATKKGIAVRKA